MQRPNSICFGLLAGGQSRRMGTDKAALLWRGQPLWRHQLRLASEIGASEILISGKSDGPYRNAAKVVPDRIADCGPLAGLCALLETMSSEWLAVVAVDMPILDGETMRRLLGERAAGRGVVPCIDGRAEPLAAVYPRAALPLAKQRVESTDRSLQAFVSEAAARNLIQRLPWPPERAGCFRSLNTREEWNEMNRRERKERKEKEYIPRE